MELLNYFFSSHLQAMSKAFGLPYLGEGHIEESRRFPLTISSMTFISRARAHKKVMAVGRERCQMMVVGSKIWRQCC